MEYVNFPITFLSKKSFLILVLWSGQLGYNDLQQTQQHHTKTSTPHKNNKQTLRLGAQSVTLVSTLRDPTQLRRHQCGTRQQDP